MLWDNYRIMAQQFWRADMDGQDWHAMTSWYDPVIDRVVTDDDFQDMMWEVMGELGTSHAYVSGAPYQADPPMKPGYLGADLEQREGRWVKIGRASCRERGWKEEGSRGARADNGGMYKRDRSVR